MLDSCKKVRRTGYKMVVDKIARMRIILQSLEGKVFEVVRFFAFFELK